jgi:glutaminyl-peptide cyclotransferase
MKLFMKKHNLLAVILLAILSSNCKGTKESIFSINETSMKEQYAENEVLNLEILNPENEIIDSVSFSINDIRIGRLKGKSKFSYALKNMKLGYSTIKSTVFFDGSTEVDSTKIEVVSGIVPKLLSYKIVNTYPHDITAYTQGLEFYNGVLYEGTGQYNESTLRKTDFKTGKIITKIDLEPKYFGEGITFLNNKIYQLTWKENTAFVYDAQSLKLLKTMPYTQVLDGWGLTNDGKNLYMSDSTEKIHVLNPENLQEVNSFNVYTNTSKIEAVNEMEWIDGKIYGNIYQKDAIAVINPTSGAVEGIINLADLKKKITQLPDTDVLNGIAYNPSTKTIFVTGKNWDKMFEIKVSGF